MLTSNTCKLGPRRPTLLILEIEADVSKNKVLNDNCFKVRSVLGGKVLIKAKTLAMSNVAIYFGKGGLRRKTALTA